MTQTAHPGTNDPGPAATAGPTDDDFPPKFAQAAEAKRRVLRHEANSTRERILDVALDLFVTQGYDGTSLREIAEQLGVTKAALYYHFKSKQDILMALHYRMHGLLEDSILGLGGGVSADPQNWPAMFDTLLDKMLANRKLFLMHDRNRAAFEGMHREGHEESHLDIEAEVRR